MEEATQSDHYSGTAVDEDDTTSSSTTSTPSTSGSPDRTTAASMEDELPPFQTLNEGIMTVGNDLHALVLLNHRVRPSEQLEELMFVHRRLQHLLAKYP